MTTIEELKPTAQQAKALASTETEILFGGGRGSGRTRLLVEWIQEGEGANLFVARDEESARHIKDVIRSVRITITHPGKLISHEYKGMRRHFRRIAIDDAENLTSDSYLEILARFAPDRVMLAAIPFGIGKEWLTERFISHPTSGRRFISSGSMANNPALGEDYRKLLFDMEEPLRSAWLTGAWSS